MNTIKFEELFTKDQMSKVIDLYCNAKIAPNKAILAYIESEPSILSACLAKDIYPPYLAYLLEYQLSCKSGPPPLVAPR